MLRSININDDLSIRKGSTDDMVREFIISTARKDGHNSVIPIESWDFEDFNKAGAFYYQHQTGAGMFTDANPDYALGPASVYVEDKKLIGAGKFESEDINELAAKIMKKVDYGTLKCTSVGFIQNGYHWGDEKRMEDPTVLYFDSVTLKEFSIVHIPSNPDAIKKDFEANNIFMLEAASTHKSEGFKRDLKYRLRKMQLDLI